MYKVFIYDKPVYLCSNEEKQVENCQQFEGLDVNKVLVALSEELNEGVQVFSKNVKKDWVEFMKHFNYIEAAGGVVENEQNEWLFIYRLGKWDLPKGKLEKNENIKACAIREVEEECNVTELKIESELPSTYHCYLMDQQWVLKRTYWFKMSTKYKGDLIPQTEEGIAKVEWLSKNKLEQQVYKNTYLSIKEVLKSS